MYNFNGNFIDLDQVVVIEKFTTDDAHYPYGLRVRLKVDGLNYGVRYTTQAARDNDANNLMFDIERVQRERYRMTVNETRSAVKEELRLARNDIKALKKTIMDMEVMKHERD